jgi:hypothetical protein
MGMQSKNRAKHKKEFDGASVAVKILASSMRTYIQTSVESKGTKAPQRTPKVILGPVIGTQGGPVGGDLN